MHEPFRGVGVALVTLFDAAGRVDVGATVDHAERVVAAGVSAVLLAGSTGEGPALEPDERMALVAAARTRLPQQVAVVAGTGAAAAPAAARATTEAVTHGADAVLALSPLRARDPRRYYAEVRAAAGEAAVLAYHFPAMAGPGIDVEDLADLDVDGLKDSSGDAERLLVELDRFPGAIYAGAAPLTLTAGLLGCAGVILALANLEPAPCVAAFQGDAAAQRALLAGHLAAQADFPHGLKRAMADRWGTPVHARMG